MPRSFFALFAVLCALALCRTASAAPPVEIVINFVAHDGVPLEARLTLPADQDGPVPVVFYFHGAGVRTYDNPFGYRDDGGQIQVGFYLDAHAHALAQRGVAFFRMSKRGCHALTESPWIRLERDVFSGATFNVLLDDYAAALAALRERPEIDPDRIVFMGSSEGTRLAPLLAKRSPEGVLAVVMSGYAQDNAHDTIVWQTSKGSWRNIQHMIPAARDGVLTREKYDRAVEDNPALAATLPFEALDADGNGVLNEADLVAINGPRLQALLQAVEDRNDDLLWTHLVQLSSSYLLDWWDAEPNHINLLALDIPLMIYHGALDGTCRVEGVYETQQAFEAAGRDNLSVHIIEDGDHDVNWTRQAAQEGGPPAYRHAYNWIADLFHNPE